MATRPISAHNALTWAWTTVILLLAAGSVQAAPSNARILSAKGTVQILSAPSDTWVAAAWPAALPPGSAVRTGPKSKAVLDLDGAEVTLYETSLIRIPATAAPASTATNPIRHPWLDSGRALFDVTPRKDRAPFSVRTPTVVAGVKGTVFEVASTGTEEAVYVWDGLVEVTSRLNSTDIRLVAAGQFTVLDDLQLTPALPIPAERTRPNEVDLHRHAAEAAAVEKSISSERMKEDFPAGTSTNPQAGFNSEIWRDADRAAVKPALDQALDFQSVVSIGTVRRSNDSLSDTLSSTTDTVTNTVRTGTDSVTSTLSPGTDSLSSTVAPVVDPLASTLNSVTDPLTSTLAPVVDPLASTTSTVTDPLLRTLGF